MVDITSKIKKIIELINKGKYFTINRPRQYGKTTTLYMLSRTLKKREGYLVIRISFESIDIPTYKNQESFIQVFLDLLQHNIEIQGLDYLSEIICNESKNINNMRELSKLITKIVIAASKKVILIIDEVDKSSNNQLFLDFLGMLRSKYLMANEGEEYTFHSVILAGVHDIKNLKLKIRNGEEKNYNSPWNIAEDFRVDLSFVVEDIATMLKEYCFEYKVNMNIESIAEKLYFYTSGYPFLVSKLCKIIDEIIIEDEKKEWAVSYVDEAVKILLKEDNTNFQSLIKNLENNKELYNFIKRIVIDGQNISYVITDNIISQGTIYGIFKDEKGICKIQNRI
ncbi:MAG: AAA-like domain-containing protein, partial [Clostridiaceae bacterium]